MTFVDIRMLFLIWAVPVAFLLYGYGIRKRRRIMRRFASPTGLAAITAGGGQRETRRWIKAALICLVLLLSAVALSGPRYGYSWKEVERKGIDIMIVLDCSRSMLAEDIAPTRLDRAKREIYDLLDMLRGDRVGLVAFAGTAFLQCPLTLDYSAFNLFLGSLSPDFFPVGGTDLAAAVTIALDGFDNTVNSEKAIILISDGEGTGAPALPAAAAASEAGVKLFSIGVGQSQGVPIPDPQGGFKKDAAGQIILTRLDEKTLEQMALNTGGTYARSVAGDMDLDVIYTQEIRGKMDPASLTSTRQQVWENRYQWALGLAILLLIIELLVPLTPRVPGKARMALVWVILLAGWPHAADADSMKDAQAAYENGAYEESLGLYIKRQLDEPDRPEVLYNIGNAYYKLGNFDAAADHFEKASQSQDKALRQKALYNLGNSAFRKGQLEAAVEHYEQALTLDPQDRQAKENLEFVKQVMAQQPAQPPPQDSQEPSAKKQPKEKNSGSKGTPQRTEANDETGKDPSSRPSPGDDDAEPDQPTQQQENGQPPAESQGQESPGADRLDTPEKSGRQLPADPAPPTDQGAADRQAAQRILNRLEDKPGKAMMPAYAPRRVEKDW